MLVTLFNGTVFILSSWLIFGLALVGLGLAVQRLFGSRTMDVDHCLMAFWMGFSITILFLQIWHFAYPVTWRALAVIIIVGGIGLSWNLSNLWHSFLETRPTTSTRYLIIVALIAVWLANRVMAPSNLWDDGLYHIQAVRWIETYAIVPGLGNLLSWLAVNSSSHLYFAIMDVWPFSGRANHLSNGLLLFVLILQIAVSASRLFRATDRRKLRHLVFDVALLTWASSMMLSNLVSSLMTDLSVGVLLFVATSGAFASFVNPSDDARDEAYRLFFVTTLFVVAVCLKLTALVFSAAMYVFVLIVWLMRNGANKRLTTWTVSWIVAMTISLGLPSLARSVILSGYPAFPIPVAGFPVEWRMPIEQVQAEMALVKHVAHWYHSLLSRGLGWEWFPGWFKGLFKSRKLLEQVVLPAGLTVVAVCYEWVRRRKGKYNPEAPGLNWLLVFPTVFAILIWFWSSAGLRYGAFLFWILAATTIALTFPLFPEIRIRHLRIGPVGLLLLIGGVPIYGAALSSMLNGQKDSLFVFPDSDRWYHVPPNAELTTRTTDSGLLLHVPTEDNRCWNAPLPCTPYPARNLRLREPNNLQSGFVVDGGWQPTNWPGPNFTWWLSHWRSSRSTE